MSKTSNEIFRISSEEKEALKLLATREGVSKGKYLRDLIKNQSQIFTLSPDEINELRKEFANITRLGSNVNQIVYHLNIMALNSQAKLTLDHKQELESLLNRTNDHILEVKELIIKLIKEKK